MLIVISNDNMEFNNLSVYLLITNVYFSTPLHYCNGVEILCNRVENSI